MLVRFLPVYLGVSSAVGLFECQSHPAVHHGHSASLGVEMEENLGDSLLKKFTDELITEEKWKNGN